MNNSLRSIARQRLAQMDAVVELADLEHTPFHRLGIAASEIIISDGIESGAA
jgi:hypothetical protein